jgi:hypothetical protein
MDRGGPRSCPNMRSDGHNIKGRVRVRGGLRQAVRASERLGASHAQIIMQIKLEGHSIFLILLPSRSHLSTSLLVYSVRSLPVHL